MSNISDFQKEVCERWKGYFSDPNIKTIRVRYKKIRNFIEREGSGKKILDLGCADGSLLEPLAKKNLVFGVEITESLSQKTRAKGLNVVKADLEKGIPFGSKTFDIVVAAQIIEHIVNTDFFLAECNRVLKKNGKLVLSVPNINTLFSPLILFLFDYPPPSSSRYRSHHVRDFTFSTLKIALKNNCFVIKKRRGVVIYIPQFSYFFKLRSFLGDLIPRWSDEYIIKAVKEKSFTYKKEEVFKKIIQPNSVVKEIPFLKWFFR